MEDSNSNSSSFNLKKWFEKLDWQDYVFLFIIIAFILLQLSFIVQFKHLPGPVYGGDIYRERGFTQSIINGTPFWASTYSLNEYAFFPWLSYLLVALLVKISNMNLDLAIHLFTVIVMNLCLLGAYLLGNKVLKGKTIALFFPISLILFRSFYDKITLILGACCVIWAFYNYIIYLESKKPLNQILSGVLLGGVALSHGSMFIGALIMFASVMVVELLIEAYAAREKIASVGKVVVEHIKLHYIMIISTFVTSALFFMPIFLKYNFQILNNSPGYSLTDIDKVTFFDMFKNVLRIFFNFSDLFAFLVGILTLIGLMYVLFNLQDKRFRFILVVFSSVAIFSFHFLITKPLFNRWMEPGHIISEVWFGKMFFLCIGVLIVVKLLHSNFKMDKLAAFGIIFLLIFVPVIMKNYANFNNDRWFQYGMTADPHLDGLYQLGDWLTTNLPNDQSILANDESAFMLNAVSGKKVVFSRRVHASYFEDVDQRYADGIVMLFGKNKTVVQKLLKDYSVRFVYIDQFLISSPMIVNKKYESYLTENGVAFTVQTVPWDPSSSSAPVFESLVVAPDVNSVLLSGFQTQNNTLITPTYPVYAESQMIAIVYTVN